MSYYRPLDPDGVDERANAAHGPALDCASPPGTPLWFGTGCNRRSRRRCARCGKRVSRLAIREGVARG